MYEGISRSDLILSSSTSSLWARHNYNFVHTGISAYLFSLFRNWRTEINKDQIWARLRVATTGFALFQTIEFLSMSKQENSPLSLSACLLSVFLSAYLSVSLSVSLSACQSVRTSFFGAYFPSLQQIRHNKTRFCVFHPPHPSFSPYPLNPASPSSPPPSLSPLSISPSLPSFNTWRVLNLK